MANLNLNVSPASTAGSLGTQYRIYYNEQLLENIKPLLLHDQFSQKQRMPRNNGKTVQWRKWTPFGALTTPLTEGTIPDGQSLAQTSVTGSINQYGGYVAISDMLSMTSIDPMVQDAVDLMSDQAALTIDTLCREFLHNNATNVQFVGNGVTSIHSITASNILTLTEIRKAVRTLKKAKAQRFSTGGQQYYIAIIAPDTQFDLQGDTTWQAVSEYQDKENIYSGEIGRVFGVRFIESTEAKIFSAPDLDDALVVSSYTAGTKTVTANLDIPADLAYIIKQNAYIKIGSQYLPVASVSGKNIVLSGTISTAPTASEAIVGVGPGASGVPVAGTLVLGKNAYGTIDIMKGGDGRYNARTIVKPQGSAGTGDPLDQISTVGWKVDGYGLAMLRPEWMVQILHGVTAA